MVKLHLSSEQAMGHISAAPRLMGELEPGSRFRIDLHNRRWHRSHSSCCHAALKQSWGPWGVAKCSSCDRGYPESEIHGGLDSSVETLFDEPNPLTLSILAAELISRITALAELEESEPANWSGQIPRYEGML